MPNVNKAIIIGHLGKDPEYRETSGGKGVTNFSVATSEKWTGQDGQKNAEELRTLMEDIITAEPLSRIDYVSAAHPVTLEELEGKAEGALLSMAVYIGKIRLIDNRVVG